MSAIQRQLAAINSGRVTKSNIIGIRKILGAAWRLEHGYSVSVTAPSFDEMSATQAREAILKGLEECRPTVTGDLHETGLQLLRSPRYRKRFAFLNDVISDDMRFDLIRFDDVSRGHFIPVYRACGWDRGFVFRAIPWQTADALGLESNWRARVAA